MTDRVTYALALSLFESRGVARTLRRKLRLVLPQRLRPGPALCVCMAGAFLAVVWALTESRLSVVPGITAPCGAIILPC